MPDDLLSPDEINALLSGGGDVGEIEDISDSDAEQLAKVSDTFANSENSVINMLAGKNVTTNVGNPEVLTQDEFSGKFSEIPFLFSTTFGGMDDLPLALVVDQKGALTLADFMMGGGGGDVPEPNDMHWNAAQEGLSQVVGSAFTSLSPMLAGRRLMPENTSSALGEDSWRAFSLEPADKKIWASPVNVTIDGVKPFNIWTCLTLDTALTIAQYMRDAIEGKKPQAPAQNNNPMGGMGGGRQNVAAVDVRPAAFQPLGGSNAGGVPSPIDLIADIPVRVTVELGKARKSVSEILGLTAGAVVELDKMAGEPVDVLVNGKLIARGEVVVIDENFGVRITDIIQGAARAAS
ncbi:MAG: flagellar motor switch protein FliN [Synergistaceae bacterium]|nr:flagellar motor switch protein FliN [Synergistaceae bacterium]MBR0075242.1 flagellar motor switch protein FliN [Synergistaceae bacterium]MBR0078880.1 flagellar motor switch protein FliN [Synergistaceae bacterium]